MSNLKPKGKRQREEEGNHSSDEDDVGISSQSSETGIADDVLANGPSDSQQNRRPRHSTGPNKRRNTTPADGEVQAIRKLIDGEVPIQQFRINFPPFAYFTKSFISPLWYWRRPVSAPVELSISGSQQVQEEQEEEDRTRPYTDEGKHTVHLEDIEDPQSHIRNRDFVVVDTAAENPQRYNVSSVVSRGRAGKILDEMAPSTSDPSAVFTDNPAELSTLARLSSNVVTGITQIDNVSARDTCGIAREKNEMSPSKSSPSINLYPPYFTEEPSESSVLLHQSSPNSVALDSQTDSNSFSDEEDSGSACDSSQISLQLDESVEIPQALVRKEKNPPPSVGYPAATKEFLHIGPAETPFRRQGELVVFNAQGEPATGRLLWDTGADYQFMSYRKARQLGFEPAPLSQKHKRDLVSTLANGQKFYPTYYLTLTIQITYLDLPSTSAKHEVSFLVMKSSYDFVFGKLYMDQHGVHAAVIREAEETAEAHNAKAGILISTAATQEEVEQNSELKEPRRVRAIAAESHIPGRSGHVDDEGADVMGTSTCKTGPCEIPAAPAGLNFPPGFGQSFGSTTPPRAHTSREESFGASTVSSDSIHRSLASSTTARSFEHSPATTTSSRSASDTEIIASPVDGTKKLVATFKCGLRLNKNAGEESLDDEDAQ